MRNPTSNLPPVVTGEGGQYLKPFWPAARGWWRASTMIGCVLMFFAAAGLAALAASNWSYSVGMLTGAIGCALARRNGGRQ